MKNKKAKIILLSTCLMCFSVLGATGILSNGFKNWNVSSWFNNNDQTNLNISDIKANGITIKRVANGIDNDGISTQIFKFTINPSNATIQTINASVKYIDGTDCSLVMQVSVDNDNKTIILKNLLEFDKKIILTLESTYDSQINCNATIDYEKKLLGIELNKSISYYPGVENSLVKNVTYSKYTKDTNLSFNFSSGTIELKYAHQHMNEIRQMDGGEEFLLKSCELIKESFYSLGGIYNITNNSYQNFPKATQFWALTDSEEIHNKILYLYSLNNSTYPPDQEDNYSENTIVFTIKNAKINVSDGNILDCPDITIETSIMSNDYKDYFVSVSEIKIDKNNINF